MMDISKEMEEPTKIIGYADDWIIYTNHKLPRVAETKHKNTAEKVMKWTYKIRCSFTEETES
jgi:hypothetical protein